jgi:hypothetical protein
VTALARPPRAIRARVAGGLLGAALVAVPIVVLARPHTPAAPASARHALPPAVSASGLAQRSGVRVVRVAASGGGGLLDLRFQVVDPGAAAAIHDARTPPALIDEQTGMVMGRLLMDHMHHGRLKAGVTYPLLFLDPGGIVRRGDRLSVVLGAARLQHVRVQ